MHEFGTKPFRALNSFGVAGVLGDEGQVFYSTLFSTRHTGRVADLIVSRLRTFGVDELALRAGLIFTVFEAFQNTLEGARAAGVEIDARLSQKFSEPLILECGFDAEKLAIGVAFTLPEMHTWDFDNVRLRVESGKPGNPFEDLITSTLRYSHRVILKYQPSIRRVEIVCLLGAMAKIPAAQLADPQRFHLVLFTEQPAEPPQAHAYVELGDLDYPNLLREDAPPLDLPKSITDTLIPGSEPYAGDPGRTVRGAAGLEDLKRTVKGGIPEIDNTQTLVKGGVPEVDHSETTIKGVTDVQNDEKIVVSGTSSQSVQLSQLSDASAMSAHRESAYKKRIDELERRLLELDTQSVGSDKMVVRGGSSELQDQTRTVVSGGSGQPQDNQSEYGSGGSAGSSTGGGFLGGLFKKMWPFKKNAVDSSEGDDDDGDEESADESKDGLTQTAKPKLKKKKAKKKKINKTENQAGAELASGEQEEQDDDEDAQDSENAENLEVSPVGGGAEAKPAAQALEPVAAGAETSSTEADDLLALFDAATDSGKKDSGKTESGKKDEIVSETELTEAEITKVAKVLVEAAPSLEAVSNSIISELQGKGGLDDVITRAQKEMTEIREDFKTERSKKWADDLMNELVNEKARLGDFARKMNVSIRQKELEFHNREKVYEDELKRKEELVRQREILVKRLKEQVAHISTNLDRVRESAAGSSNEELALKQKLHHAQKMATAHREEADSLRSKIEELRGQLDSSQAGAKAKGASSNDHLADKMRMDKALKQIDELKRVNNQLQEKISADARKAALPAASPGGEEAKKKLAAATKVITITKRENDRLTTKVEELQREEIRLKADLNRSLIELKRMKSRGLREGQGGGGATGPGAGGASGSSGSGGGQAAA